MIEKKRGKTTIPRHNRFFLIKYLSGDPLRLLHGAPVEVVRRDRSAVTGRFIASDYRGVILETAPDEITAIPLADVRTVRRPRANRAGAWPSTWCITDCSACGRITLCRRTQGRGIA